MARVAVAQTATALLLEASGSEEANAGVRRSTKIASVGMSFVALLRGIAPTNPNMRNDRLRGVPTLLRSYPDASTGVRCSRHQRPPGGLSRVAGPVFLIARNPEEDSKLPYLAHLPIEGGLVLKAHDTWPRSARIYCHPYEADWPGDAEIVEEARVSSIRRRGPVIDLVLHRPRLARSQFVFTETRGRPAIFWQTRKAARAANPGARIPRARAIPEGFRILIDTRERYPYRFTRRGRRDRAGRPPAGDYAVAHGEAMAAAVERKTFENFTASLSDGTLAFQMHA